MSLKYIQPQTPQEREARYQAALNRLKAAGILSPKMVQFAQNVHEGAKRPGRGLKGFIEDTTEGGR